MSGANTGPAYSKSHQTRKRWFGGSTPRKPSTAGIEARPGRVSMDCLRPQSPRTLAPEKQQHLRVSQDEQRESPFSKSGGSALAEEPAYHVYTYEVGAARSSELLDRCKARRASLNGTVMAAAVTSLVAAERVPLPVTVVSEAVQTPEEEVAGTRQRFQTRITSETTLAGLAAEATERLRSAQAGSGVTWQHHLIPRPSHPQAGHPVVVESSCHSYPMDLASRPGARMSSDQDRRPSLDKPLLTVGQDLEQLSHVLPAPSTTPVDAGSTKAYKASACVSQDGRLQGSIGFRPPEQMNAAGQTMVGTFFMTFAGLASTKAKAKLVRTYLDPHIAGQKPSGDLDLNAAAAWS